MMILIQNNHLQKHLINIVKTFLTSDVKGANGFCLSSTWLKQEFLEPGVNPKCHFL